MDDDQFLDPTENFKPTRISKITSFFTSISTETTVAAAARRTRRAGRDWLQTLSGSLRRKERNLFRASGKKSNSATIQRITAGKSRQKPPPHPKYPAVLRLDQATILTPT